MKTGKEIYNDWAEHYDRDMAAGAAPVSFEGYEDVLAEAVQEAKISPGMRVLDLGTGTGNLAAGFIDEGCEVWGTDFSENMLSKAREKLPSLHAVLADLRDETWAQIPTMHFDRIVSAYVLHEFDRACQLEIIKRLTGQYLSPKGRLVIADIAYPDATSRAQAQAYWGKLWSEEEYYWAADETSEACHAMGLSCSYRQVSSCAGVFVMEVVQEK